MSSRPGHRGLGVDATLAAVATLTAAWPISTLLAQPTWLRGTVLLLAVIIVSGVAARSLALRSWQVLSIQLVCLILAASAIFGQGHLWHGLPTLDTLRYADSLVAESISTAQRFSAPAPTTPGLLFVVGCSLGLLALAVDYLAVTVRSPALAGLPLLTIFLTAVANRGSTLPVGFFLATATMWLILVARADGTVLRRWATTVTMTHTPARQSLESRGIYEHASMARMLGAVALVAAVAVPILLPQTPTRFLGSGLGRSPSADGNSSNGVGFSQSLDLAADLKDRSKAPVLQYTTADTSPPPLRVAVGSYYRPEPGLWLPWGRPRPSTPGTPDLSLSPRVPEPTGLARTVPRGTYALEVHRNVLEDPYLATPYPLISADLGGVLWGADDQTQTVRVAQRPDSYTVSYWHLEPTTAMLRNAPPLNYRDRDLFDLDLRLEQPYVGRVTTLAGQLTTGKSSTYDQAMAIQQYLRADGGFTYSLTLAPPVKNRAGKSAGYDALTNFLITKKGYCVQFATAMVMMSRALGIPARLSLGFLPGTEAKGVWTVLASDAHAWPELYLDGIGWTRFEPTPSRATPPAYATPVKSSGTGANSRPKAKATTPPQGKAGLKDRVTASAGARATHETGLGAISAVRWLTHGWGPLVFGCLMVLLGSLLVPTAARWRRRRRLTHARSAAEEVEVQWDLLTSSLGDLGIAPAPSRTPRQLRAYYDHEALLEGEASEALGRVVQTLERSRYAVSPTPPRDISTDTRRVVRAAAATRDGKVRLRAALWPSSGTRALRSAGAHFTGRIRAPLRRISDLIHRR